MTKKMYALAFAFAEPDAIVAVLGDSVAKIIFTKISSAWLKATEELLSRHTSEHGKTTKQGVVYRTFTSNTADIMFDEEEQIETLFNALQRLSRQLLIDEFGGGTGLKIDIQTLVTPVSQAVLSDQDISQLQTQLEDKAASQSVCHEKSPYADIDSDGMAEVIEQRYIETYLQAIVNVSDNRIVGFEALTRGKKESEVHRADKLFGSAAYFGMTEALELACVDVALSHLHSIPEDYFLTINTGPKVLMHPSLVDMLKRPGVNEHLHRVIFEITEHLPIDDVKALYTQMRELCELGVKFALDDTGCGFFDLETAYVLKPEIVKLCISVIRQIDTQGVITKEITQTREKLDELNATTLGEGVEEAYQLEALKQAGVQYYQGFLFDRPEPVAEKLAALVE